MKLLEIFNIKILKVRTNSNEITLEEARKMKRNNPNIFLLDVRSPQEYQESHLEDAILIPLYELKYKISRIIPNKQAIIIVYCLMGTRSKKAIKILQQLDYKNIYHIKGGLNNSNFSV